MLEVYLDSADLSAIADLAQAMPLAGVTTNPSILAAGGIGLNKLLPALSEILGHHSRFHVQVVGNELAAIVAEAEQLATLPYDIVVKIPAHAAGLAAIKQVKQRRIPVLATAIYNPQQGMLAALNGADYLAPYLNRIDNLGFDGVAVVSELQQFLERYQLPCKQLVASFKNVGQVLRVLQLGVGAVTVPPEIARQMIDTPYTDSAVVKFQQDWQHAFTGKLSYDS